MGTLLPTSCDTRPTGIMSIRRLFSQVGGKVGGKVDGNEVGKLGGKVCGKSTDAMTLLEYSRRIETFSRSSSGLKINKKVV